jgi:predicted DNA-binding WGR domain protein
VEYQLDKWKRQDWRKNSRHYSCEVRQNLFGQWVVLRRWGRVSALQGQSREVVCDRYEEGLEILEAVGRRRSQRGYSTCE